MTTDKATTKSKTKATATSGSATLIINNETETTTTTTTTDDDYSYPHYYRRYISRHLTPEYNISPETAKAVWRDVFFLMLGAVALSIVGFVETHAMDAESRVMSVRIAGMLYSSTKIPVNPHGIVDSGFMMTYPLYEFLKENRDWNDWLAFWNSVMLIVPTVYAAYVTLFWGDYTCVFRILAVQLLRSFCGWFTYLPPDPTYLNSYYDFPDFVHCIFKDCHADDDDNGNGNNAGPEVLPFVSFFSGHVATVVVVANHMALHKKTQPWAILMHTLNVFQIVRLLATRGHYSIDIIIGWYVAVYVSERAGRLGRYYSKGTSFDTLLPKTPMEAFEYATGVADTKRTRRYSILMQHPEVKEAMRKLELAEHEDDKVCNIESETTVRILQQAASKLMQEHAARLQEEIQHLQEQAQQAVNAMKEQRRRERQEAGNKIIGKKDL